MNRIVWGIAVLLVTAPNVAAQTSSEAPELRPVAPRSLRLVKDEFGNTLALQTSTIHYQRAKDPRTVDLISAIHIGDLDYYRGLQHQFEGYDALLFELVKTEDTPLPEGSPSQSLDPLSMLMTMGLDAIELESQTDHIDYRKKNFVHADLSPAQMWEAIEARGDNAFTLGLSMMADMLRQQNMQTRTPARSPAPLDLMSILFDPDGTKKLKAILAEEMLSSAADTFGKTLNSIVIEDRNLACMNVLGKQWKAGKKRCGIFYGAAHMEDFDRRLQAQGFVPTKVTWITAWDLR